MEPKSVKLVNLLMHTVNIRTPEGEVTVLPSGTVARLKTQGAARKVLVEGTVVTVVDERNCRILDLPPPSPGVIYIVTPQVLTCALAAGRTDVVAAGRPVRGTDGKISACKNLWGPGVD